MSSHKSPITEPPQEEAECEIVSPVALALNGHTKDTTNDSEEQDTKEEQLVVEAQLLQLTKDSTGSAVKISGGQFTSFLASLAALPSQVTTLNAKTQTLRTEYAKVTDSLRHIERRYGCTEFRFFPKLPLELRRMIWQLAITLATPRVLGLLRLKQKCWGDDAPYSYIPALRTIYYNTSSDMLFFFDQNNEVGSIYMVVQGIQSHFLNLFGLLEVRFIPRFACHYLASEEVLEDDPHYMAMSLEAFQELKTEEIILVVGSKELCRGPNLAFRNPSKPPLETLSKQYYEKRKLELGLTDMSQHLSWQKLEDQQLDKIQRVREYHVRGRKYFTDQGLDPNYQELYNLDNGHSNCLYDPNDWTVKKVTFMEATTAIALKKQTIS